MAELLVMAADIVNHLDPVLDYQCLKRGDVIVACADGWPWSDAERTNPNWRILKVPGLTLDKMRMLTTQEPGNIGVTPQLRQRALKIDLDSALLTKELTDTLADTKRDVQVVELDAQLLDAIIEGKAAAPDIRLVGA